MLVFGRRTGERIVINDDIEITVVRIEQGKVRIGVTAPRSVSIHRAEIYRAINGLGDPSADGARRCAPEAARDGS